MVIPWASFFLHFIWFLNSHFPLSCSLEQPHLSFLKQAFIYLITITRLPLCCLFFRHSNPNSFHLYFYPALIQALIILVASSRSSLEKSRMRLWNELTTRSVLVTCPLYQSNSRRASNWSHYRNIYYLFKYGHKNRLCNHIESSWQWWEWQKLILSAGWHSKNDRWALSL